MLKIQNRLALAAAIAFAATGAIAAPFNIDGGNAANGITNIYSTTIQGGLAGCGATPTPQCTFFGGQPPGPSIIGISPNPTGVNGGTPLAISPTPLAGSFLDVSLTGGNTLAQIASDSTISLPPLTLTIGSTVITAANAGFVIKPSAVVAELSPGSGQFEFYQNNSPGLAADFSTLGAVVTSCSGSLCGLLGALSLDMVRYYLFLDFDPTYTQFTGSFIGQTASNSLVYANLNSVVPVPAAVWLMGSALGLLGWVRRKALA